MAFPSIEAKLEYLYGKVREAGWTISDPTADHLRADPQRRLAFLARHRGVKLTKDGQSHELYVPVDIAQQLGGEDRGRMLADQKLCGDCLRRVGIYEKHSHLLWF